MKFYGRVEELGVLAKAVSGKSAEMFLVSGRRRIGKSRLVDEFLKTNSGAKVLVVPKAEKQVAQDFAAALSEGYSPVFNTVKEAFEYFFTKSTHRILYVDEFPNFLEVNTAIPYELQSLWETHKLKTNKVLVFSGSYVSMMDKLFTKQKAPLFNRAGYVIILQPLGMKIIWQMQEDLGIKDSVQKIFNYCILGGVPFYYELLEKREKNSVVNELFFNVGAPLKEEGLNVLRQEFGAAYKTYFSILEAIGAGIVSSGEISNKLGLSQTTLSKYLAALQHDFKLVGRFVPFGQNPRRSKKGVYYLQDNALSFWFTHVYGKTLSPTQQDLATFVGKRFELLCMDFMAAYLQNQGKQVIRFGKWWGHVEVEEKKFEEREIDLIIETQDAVYVGECKWTNAKQGERDLEYLKTSASALAFKKPVKWVLFTKNPPAVKQAPDLLLFDSREIIEKT